MGKFKDTYISLPTAMFYGFLVVVAVMVWTHLAYLDHQHRQDSELRLSGVYGVQE